MPGAGKYLTAARQLRLKQPDLRRVLPLFWPIYLALVLLLHLGLPEGGQDYRYYHRASAALAAGENPYGLTGGLPYLYPPLTALLLTPLTRLFSLESAMLVWLILNILLLWSALYLLSLSIRSPHLKLLIWLAPPFFSPVLLSLVHGQITVVLLLLFVAAFYALQREQPFTVGVLLALAAWIKVFPVALILYFVWKRAWRVVIGAAMAGITLGLVQLLWIGPEHLLHYFSDVLFDFAVDGLPQTNYLSASSLGFTNRLFMTTRFVNPLLVNESLAVLAHFGLRLLVVAATVWSVSRPLSYRRTGPAQRRLEYAIILAGALLFSPTLWESGLLQLLLVYAVLIDDALPALNYRVIAACALSMLLIDLHRIIWLVAHQQTLPALLLSFPFYGIFLIWIVAIRQRLRPRPAVLTQISDNP